MKKVFVLSFLFASILLSACTPQNNISEKSENEAKYVFLFIGDGMGIPQMYLTEAYMQTMKNDKSYKLNMTQLPVTGLSTTWADNRFITGSAAAGTALATGNKTSINTIGMDAAKEKPLKSIAKIAQADGKKIGILSSVYINHATPAVFYANQPERKMLYEIALDLSTSNFDYFGGGGLAAPKGKNGDKEIDAYEQAEKNGYTITNTVEAFNKLTKDSGKVIAIAPDAINGKEMTYALDGEQAISLADFTKKGIELLNNDNGFFMMVEGGKIDWACHSNDAASSIQETIEFDNAIAVALEFYKQHPDETLIVVTADHETGGLTLGTALNHYETDLSLLSNQKTSIEEFEKVIEEYKKNTNPREYDFTAILKIIEEHFGLGNAEKGLELNKYDISLLKEAFYQSIPSDRIPVQQEELYLKYNGTDPMVMTANHILARKTGINWGSYSHTALPVPVFAIGTHSEVFGSYIDNTDIPKEIINAMKIK
jgi:alkaline phosphatase